MIKYGDNHQWQYVGSNMVILGRYCGYNGCIYIYILYIHVRAYIIGQTREWR